MYRLKVNNLVIKNYLAGMTISDEVKIIINDIIDKYDHSYTHLLYSIFNVYLKSYVQLTDENCSLSKEEIIHITDKFNIYLPKVNSNQILIIDKLDLIFTISTNNKYDCSKFSSYFYEDIYNKIENYLGVEKANVHLEDIFAALESIVLFVESSMISISNKNEEIEQFNNLYLYVDLYYNDLILTFF